MMEKSVSGKKPVPGIRVESVCLRSSEEASMVGAA